MSETPAVQVPPAAPLTADELLRNRLAEIGRKGGMSTSDKKRAAVSKNMKKAARISHALARQKKKA